MNYVNPLLAVCAGLVLLSVALHVWFGGDEDGRK